MLKGRWVLAAIFLGLLLLVAGWILWTPAPYTIRLPDGRQFTLKAVTFGTQHRMVLGQPWARPLASFLPPTWARRVGVELLTYTTAAPSLMIWGAWQTNPKHGAVNYAALAGEDGTELDAIHYQSSAYHPKYRSVMGWNFTSFPRRESEMTVRLYPGNNARTKRLIEFKIPNPAPRSYPAWKPESYPIQRKAGQVEFVLTKLTVGGTLSSRRWTPVGPSLHSWKVATVEVREGQLPSSAWTITHLEVADATGNVASGPVQTRSERRGEITCRFSHMLWPDEPAHRLTFEFARQSGFATNDLRQVRAVPVPLTNQPSRVSTAFTNHGVTITSVALHRTAPGPSPMNATLQNHLAVVTVLPPSPGVRVSLAQAQDDRKRTVRFGEEVHYPNGQVHIPLEVPEGARAMDFILAIHRTRLVEYYARAGEVTSDE